MREKNNKDLELRNKPGRNTLPVGRIWSGYGSRQTFLRGKTTRWCGNWLVIAVALFAADSIPKVWGRLHPTRDEPELADSPFSQARRRLGVARLRQLLLKKARAKAEEEVPRPRPTAADQTLSRSDRSD